jgi:hypothetical protein
MKNETDDTVEAAILKNDYRIRYANHKYLVRTAGKAVKWTVIGVGLATIAGYAFKDKNTNEEVTS